ncbi:MAG: NAD(P)H-dependent glycerol-3-phosphate dehydrogenase, partial [Clostridia bacterium]
KDRENKEFLPGVPFGGAKLIFTSDIDKAADFGEVIVSAVPSKAAASTAEKLSKNADGKIIVNVSKGIDETTLTRLSQVFAAKLPHSPIVVLSGPSHAEEVARGIPTTNVAACVDMEVARKVQQIFNSETFRVYTNPDVCGVELGGALKNVIALCAGITDGCGFGDNTKAALMTRGLHEITRLGVKMGANEKTFAGLSGVGDLIVTCTSMHSRNRRAGILLGQGKSLAETLETVHMTVEGVGATKAGYELGKKYGVELPIIEQAHAVLFEGKNPALAVRELMTRSAKSEDQLL